MMKRTLIFLLTLCLLLSGCGSAGGDTPVTKPTAPPAPYTPRYTDYTGRDMTAAVLPYAKELPRLGDLNNLYQNQAAALFAALETDTYRRLREEPPSGMAYLQISFRPRFEQSGEVITVYENDRVMAGATEETARLYTAAEGLYQRVLTHLIGVREGQIPYFTVQAEGINDDGYHEGGYTLCRDGKPALSATTGEHFPCVELVDDGLVRVVVEGTTFLYDTATGRRTADYGTPTDLWGERLAAYTDGAVALYRLFESRPLGRVYIAAPQGVTSPVTGLSFEEEGEQLHLICRTGEDSVRDFTLSVASLEKGNTQYLLGDWKTASGYVSESKAQSVGYNALKQLRGKQAQLGYTLSAVPTHVFTLDGTPHYLTEIGRWKGSTYTVVTHLMVPADLSAGYEVKVTENALRWYKDKNWFD